jgi:hypothetical protein
MTKTYSLPRIKTITSHPGLSRFLAECDQRDDGLCEIHGWLARVQVEDIPSPYASSPTKVIYCWHGKQIIYFETSHKRYEVFQVPAQLLRFDTDEKATDWHIRFSRKPRAA